MDFMWPNKAPMVIALGGEVVDIRSVAEHEGGYYVQVVTSDFIVNYNVSELYVVNPDIGVGSQVVTGQLLGYPFPVPDAGGWHSTHWEFGKYEKIDDPKPNHEGIVEKYRTSRLCPVPYLTDSERARLFRIWETAAYDEKDLFPELCNGYYKNY
jgi:hypothetical protein